jgi:hypothetical protein
MLTLKEPFQRTAAGPPVQPDDDFVGRIRVGRGKEPKEEFGCILRARDGQKAGIGFADIEIDIWDRTAVDRVFCDLLDTPHSLEFRRRRTLRVVVQEMVWSCSFLELWRSRLCLRRNTPPDLWKRLAHMLSAPLCRGERNEAQGQGSDRIPHDCEQLHNKNPSQEVARQRQEGETSQQIKGQKLVDTGRDPPSFDIVCLIHDESLPPVP